MRLVHMQGTSAVRWASPQKSRDHALSLVALIALLWAAAVCGQEPGRPVLGEAKTTFLTTWSERLRAMRSLHMVFTQEKTLPVLRRPFVTQGELWLKGETLLYVLKNPAGATELALRVDQQAIQTYYPLLKTLEVIETRSAATPPLALPFLTPDPAALAKEYDVDLFQVAERHTLRLIPRDSKAPLQELRLVLHDFQPREVMHSERNGTRVTMQITSFVANPEISEAQMALPIPEGTKVTYPLK